MQLQEIALSDLTPSPLQPRTVFDEAKLAELTASIEQGGGILEPLIGRKVNGKIEVIAGERRLRAARKAKLKTVPVVVREMTDVEVMEAQLVENIQREDMNPLDEAEGMAKLIAADPATYTVKALASKIGLSEASVYLKLQLTKLIEPGRELLREGKIDTAHGAALGRLSEADQKEAIAWMKQQAQHSYPDKGTYPTIKALRGWIQQNVRLDLFSTQVAQAQPGVAAKLEKLKAKGIEPLQLSREYQTKEVDGQKILGTQSYREASGKKKCAHAVPAAFVYGDEVELTEVCTARDKCKDHWKWEMQQAAAARRQRQASSPARQTPEAKKRQAAAKAKAEKLAETHRAVAVATIAAAVKNAKKISHDTLARMVLSQFDGYNRPEELMDVIESLKVPAEVLRMSFNARTGAIPKLSDAQLAGLAIINEAEGLEHSHNAKELEPFAKRHNIKLAAIRKGVEAQLAAKAEPEQQKLAAKGKGRKKR